MDLKQLKTLVKLANHLDRKGLYREADALESILKLAISAGEIDLSKDKVTDDEEEIINGMNDNNVYLAHATIYDSALDILNDGFHFGAGLTGKTLFTSKNSILASMELAKEGKLHRGSDAIVIFSFEKSIFPRRIRSPDDISDYFLDEGTTTVPPEYIYKIYVVNKRGK